MNNFEKIKQMTVEELANWLDDVSTECSDMCIVGYKPMLACSGEFCKNNIKQWLLQEVEE